VQILFEEEDISNQTKQLLFKKKDHFNEDKVK
jgi:hypothetical protein